MNILKDLKPANVFAYFERLCAVPHGSGNTKQISDLIASMAEELHLPWEQDEWNNVIIRKPGSIGYESSEPVILQGHMDMVCVTAEDCSKDMSKEGLDLATDGTYVWAQGTSLGGDDCIAVAVILAILADDSLAHPPIEAVFTSDEETGMTGAVGIDCSGLKGKKLLNLDSEEEGFFTVSCAGGTRCDCFLPGRAEMLFGETVYDLELAGLTGGHSGVEIHQGRANANVEMARLLYTALEVAGDLRIADIGGGRFDNAICNRCVAKVAVPASQSAAFEQFLGEFEAVLKNEFAVTDPALTLTWKKGEASAALSARVTKTMLHALLILPHGVQTMSPDFPGLVRTSLNLGIMKLQETGLKFSLLVRSGLESEKELTILKIRSVVEYAGGKTELRNSYPAWQYNRESPLKDLVLESYRATTGKEGEITGTHGGLECGMFIGKIPGLDAVSYGPNLYDIHSERERVEVSSVEHLYDITCDILKHLK